jgi:uncharacterized protein (DUF1015 family)
MQIRPFSAIFPNLDYISSADSFFGTVKEQYPEYVLSGFFNEQKPSGMYVYQIETSDHPFIGLTCCVEVDDYLEGRIKKHENTIAAKEQMQMQLLLRRNAAVKPVLLVYKNIKKLDEWLKDYISEEKPEFEIDFEDSGEIHRYWPVRENKDISFLQKLFLEKIPESYIADGHHRISATTLLHNRTKDNPKVTPHNKILCSFFPISELEVHDFNRVIHSLENISMATFMAMISKVMDIEPMRDGKKPTQKHELTMYLRHEWFRLQWRPHVLEEYAKDGVVLDTTLLNQKVLRDILEMKDVRTDVRIENIEGPKGLKSITKRVNRDEHSVGFCLYPLTLEELMHIADEDKVLPPKSTWFEPRMKNGLIVKEY